MRGLTVYLIHVQWIYNNHYAMHSQSEIMILPEAYIHMRVYVYSFLVLFVKTLLCSFLVFLLVSIMFCTYTCTCM